MITDELKQCIRDTRENDNFDYTQYSVQEILKKADIWQHDWTTLYKRILRRIKAGKGVPDGARANGQYVSLPIDSGKYMTVFFETLSSGRNFVYDFKIEDVR